MMSANRTPNTPPDAAVGDDAAAGSSAATSESAAAPSEPNAEALQQALEQERAQHLRALAEMRNFKLRAERDKAEALRYAESEFARELLTVLDDLDRTLETARNGADAAALVEGVRIVCEHFMKVLRARGIEPIDAQGAAFDPQCHEALLQQPSDTIPAQHVAQTLVRGYRMHDRVLRPARVIVSAGPAASPSPAATEE